MTLMYQEVNHFHHSAAEQATVSFLQLQRYLTISDKCPRSSKPFGFPENTGKAFAALFVFSSPHELGITRELGIILYECIISSRLLYRQVFDKVYG